MEEYKEYDDFKLLNDKEVARMIGMSPSYIRTERYKRRHGLPHNFDVGPVLIGKSPRYRYKDITDYIKRLKIAA